MFPSPLVTIFLSWSLTLVAVASHRSNRLLREYGGNRYAVQIHPKHRSHYHRTKAAKVQQASYIEFDDEMDPFPLGVAVDHSGWITYSLFRKKKRCVADMKSLAGYGAIGDHEGVELDEEQTEAIDEYSTECETKCNEMEPDSFDLWAQCFASCWYVSDGNMAGVSKRGFVSPDPSTDPVWRPAADFRNAYSHFMKYLFKALHNGDRWDEIKRLYKEQQEMLAEDAWDGGLSSNKNSPFKKVLEPMVAHIKKLYNEKKMEGKLFIWRGISDVAVTPKAPIDTSQAELIKWGPASCSTELVTPIIAARRTPVGTILRIEIPLDPLKGTDADIRGGKTVAWLTENFGLVDMFKKKYANKAHMNQKEVLLYSFPATWIKVEAIYKKGVGMADVKKDWTFPGVV